MDESQVPVKSYSPKAKKMMDYSKHNMKAMDHSKMDMGGMDDAEMDHSMHDTPMPSNDSQTETSTGGHNHAH